MRSLKSNIAAQLAILFCLSGTLSAFDGDDRPTSDIPSQAQIVLDANQTLLTTFSSNYDLAFRKTLDEKHPFFSLYYRNLSTNATSFYMISETDRITESRVMARQALYAALQNTVNNVNLLYTLKEYSRAMTSANMNVKNGKMNFDGPSLKNAGNQDDPSPQESLRSSLMLINNADFGLSFKTSFGEFQTNLTYFVAGRDIVGASVRRELFHDASLELDYRVAPSENHTFLTLHLPFNY